MFLDVTHGDGLADTRGGPFLHDFKAGRSRLAEVDPKLRHGFALCDATGKRGNLGPVSAVRVGINNDFQFHKTKPPSHSDRGEMGIPLDFKKG